MPFSDFVRMRTYSLVPKPNTTIIGLGVRLVHERNLELTMRTAGMVSFRSRGQGLWTPHGWGAAFSCQLSLVPRPPLFCVLRFGFSIIWKWKSAKNGEGLVSFITWEWHKGRINCKYVQRSVKTVWVGPNACETWPVQMVQSKNASSSSDWQV